MALFLIIFFLKASEILLFNRKLNAQEAFERNLINEIIPLKDFSKIVWEKIERISKLSPKVNILKDFLRHRYKVIYNSNCYFQIFKLNIIIASVVNKPKTKISRLTGTHLSLNNLIQIFYLRKKIRYKIKKLRKLFRRKITLHFFLKKLSRYEQLSPYNLIIQFKKIQNNNFCKSPSVRQSYYI